MLHSKVLEAHDDFKLVVVANICLYKLGNGSNVYIMSVMCDIFHSLFVARQGELLCGPLNSLHCLNFKAQTGQSSTSSGLKTDDKT